MIEKIRAILGRGEVFIDEDGYNWKIGKYGVDTLIFPDDTPEKIARRLEVKMNRLAAILPHTKTTP